VRVWLAGRQAVKWQQRAGWDSLGRCRSCPPKSPILADRARPGRQTPQRESGFSDVQPVHTPGYRFETTPLGSRSLESIRRVRIMGCVNRVQGRHLGTGFCVWVHEGRGEVYPNLIILPSRSGRGPAGWRGRKPIVLRPWTHGSYSAAPASAANGWLSSVRQLAGSGLASGPRT
jgi:hypothetical protein